MAENRNNPSKKSQDQRGSEGERAQQMLEDVGKRVGRFFASAAARTREEAEDIWAEAQSIRRGERQ